MKSLRKTDLKNWSNILNIRFELTIDSIKDTKRNKELSLRYDRRPENKVDSIFYKLTLNIFDKY